MGLFEESNIKAIMNKVGVIKRFVGITEMLSQK